MTTPYDHVAYPAFAYPDTHPDHLATIATLFGMSPPALPTCRVLELGCGDGANLIPMALTIPGSTCVGIDLAERAIERARACAGTLELTNVTFACRDLADLDGELGPFDYIIAHGLYSWVPADVRDRLLAVCKRYLAPHGIAFVSYNAHPGGHLRQIVRGMMAFRARAVPPEPMRQVAEGLAFARWIAESTPSDDLRRILQPELDALTTRSPSVVYHDELSPDYAPVYFFEFVDHANRHGLQYVADAEFSSMQSARFPAPLAETLHKIGDMLVKEQLQDFLRLRKFRQSLLCHADIPLDRSLDARRMRRMWVASAATPEPADADGGTDGTDVFRTTQRLTMSTNHPLAKAALRCLGEAWPRSIPFPELAVMARARMSVDAGDAEDAPLDQLLLAAYSADFVELSVQPRTFSLDVGAHPRASPLARWQLQDGVHVTTLRHVPITIEDPLLRRLVVLLDGTRDHVTLRRELTAFALSGDSPLEREGRVITGADEVATILSRELPQALAGVARLALLTD